MRALRVLAVAVIGVCVWAGPVSAQGSESDTPAAPETTTTTAPVEQIGVLTIPRMDLRIGVFEGVTEASLTAGVAHYPNTPVPGQVGNAGIAGHRNVAAAAFGRIAEVVPGDHIHYLWADGVTETMFVVESVETLPTSDPKILAVEDRVAVTLTAAEGDGSQQIVVGGVADTAPAADPVVDLAVASTTATTAQVASGTDSPGGTGLFAGAMAVLAGVALLVLAVNRR